MTSPNASTVTMADVARASGVSVMTVSYALNQPERVAGATRSKVLEHARRLGYAGPNPIGRSLRRRRTDCVGIVLREHLAYAFDDPQAARFLSGVSEVLSEHGYGITFIPARGDDERDAGYVRAAAVDSFIVWTTEPDDLALQAALETGHPVVVQGGPRLPGLRCIGIDDRTAARTVAAAAFVGAKRPAVLSLPMSRERVAGIVHAVEPKAATFPVTRARLAGIRDYCDGAGIAAEQVTVAVAARNTPEDGRAAVATLLAERPDAVLAMSDQLAGVLIEQLAAGGLSVPGDVAVTGWDDGPLAESLDLTTIRQDLRAQGVTCARLALGLTKTARRAEWQLVERGSTRR